jgi:hypothetical protein
VTRLLSSLAWLITIAGPGHSGSTGVQTSKCQLSRLDSAYLASQPLYRDCAVDQKAQLIGLAPTPDLSQLQLRRVGRYSAVIQFVVDSAGIPESNTVRVARTSSDDFAQAIITTIPRLRYRPARKGGIAVRQIVTIEREMTASLERR